jgi:hypothetical protein
VTNTIATSYLSLSSLSAASAAESAAQRKEIRYSEIMKTHLFYYIVFETLRPINSAGQEFSELGHRISAFTDDPRVWRAVLLFNRQLLICSTYVHITNSRILDMYMSVFLTQYLKFRFTYNTNSEFVMCIHHKLLATYH